MKILIAVFVLTALCSVSSHAMSLAQLCGRYSADATLRCLEAGKGYIEPGAVDICNRYSNDGIIQCVRIIAGRSYTDEELALCNRYSNGGIMQCLEAAGRRQERRGGDEGGQRGKMRQIVRDCEERHSSDSKRLRCIEDAVDL